jgi:tetratricopeptide (TPR) repeat protein
MELNPNLKILEVTDAASRKLDFARSHRLGSPKFSVGLAEPCGPEQAIALTITYEGALPAGWLDYITKDGILLRDESRWYPAVDLSAFTQNQINISVPSRWRAITSGGMAGSIGAGLSANYRWRTSQPVSSRAIVAFPEQPETCVPMPVPSGGYWRLSPLSACFVGPHQDAGVSFAAAAHELLEHYNMAFGRYPHAELYIVEGFPGQRGAIGYSAPGFLVVSEDAVKFHDYPSYAPEFLPHEIAHQWFPIAVTLAREEDGWLAESLAEYLAWRYLAETNPTQARRMVAQAMRDALAPEPLRPLLLGLHLFALESSAVTQATLYQRGMLVWRTLEAVIDREHVDRALSELYKRYAGKPASIADFRKVCEEISGRDLGWFFDYFIDGTRIPEIEMLRMPSSAAGEVSGQIILKNTPPEFNVSVEMRVETSAGTIEHSVATRGEVTPFTVTAPNPVTRILLDPDQRILRWTEAAQRNRNQGALLAKVGELESAGELARAVEAYEKALAADPENLASNEQQIRFALGRLRYGMKQDARAFQEFTRVLALGSLDPMQSDFNRVWSRVYRARIERRRGHLAAARAEAGAGLEIKSPVVETRVTLPESPERTTSAAAELQALAR